MSSMLSFSDIAAQRQSSEPLTGTIAPITTSEMFKSPRCSQKPPAKSFEHRLNLEARSRGAATLKAAGAELSGDVISLGTGRPSPEYFPFLKMSMDFPSRPEYFESSSICSESKTIGKYDIQDKKSTFDLAVSLNYGHSAGSEQLIRFLTEHVDVVHNPPYSDWQCSLTAGSTSAIDCIFRTFCERGDFIITEEYTYSAIIEAARPIGVRTIGVPMDDQGLSAVNLDALISGWNPAERGARKPFLLYLIPTGQNPTGVTQSLERRNEIYDVAERHDLYIIEDDPYYFLRLGLGTQVSATNGIEPTRSATEAVDSFLCELVPSFLSLDVSGRVLRLDSTSKILAPGLRCSWMTGSAEIISRFLYLHDATVVCPSGLSQLAVHTLLDEVWGHEGLVNWLIHLQNEYTERLNVMLKSCEDYLPRDICSWQTPKAGMFHWIKIDWRAHPMAISTAKSEFDTMLDIEDRIYCRGLKMGVMCCKGSAFRAGGAQGCDLFFRVTFASASLPQITEAIARFGKAICEEFKDGR
ncbi:aromatic aminotransferase Aro8 [Penicillium longicatenatum]|uniref:aromatic aminotransferase Aro8 n=1 Tax=Penicillium longicatenatum TaxID=1561947 RepID=UPI00254998BF|nr:aromatic aminotransferase Aro8 [Penicillium longicatenatum]KAJ5639384.1 aromatic aminotransferase Aro8 [Penicillium longicatenatum]